MSSSSTETASPEVNPAQVVGLVETDTFCDKCGFNLHTQKVWREDRLGILVCRCPECGAHQAAGMRTTVGHTWMNRLALAGMVLWVALALGYVATLFVGLLGLQAIASEALMVGGYESPEGEPLTNTYDPKKGLSQWVSVNDPTKVVASPVYVRRPVYWLSAAPRGNRWGPDPIATLLMAGMLAFALFLATSALTCGSWFWKRGRVWAWLLLPVGAYLLVMVMMSADTKGGFSVAIQRHSAELIICGGVLVLQLIVMSAALLWGRITGRLVLSMFLPRKARQLFAFLWECDGKVMR